MKTPNRLMQAISPLAKKRAAMAKRLQDFVFHPNMIRRAFGAQDASTGSRSTLAPDTVASNASRLGASLVKEKTRAWKIGACQIAHVSTVANADKGATMRYAVSVPFSDGSQIGTVEVPVSVVVTEGRLFVANEQATSHRLRQASRGELPPSQGFGATSKRTAQFENAPMLSKEAQQFRAQLNKQVEELDKIESAVQKVADKARAKVLKDMGVTEDDLAAKNNNENELRAQYAEALLKDVKRTKQSVYQTVDKTLVTLAVGKKANPSYEGIVLFLKAFFRKGDKLISGLLARYSWLSVTYSAFETEDPKAMQRKLKDSNTNVEEIDQFKTDRAEADNNQAWNKLPDKVADKKDREKMQPKTSPTGKTVMEKFGQLSSTPEEIDPEDIKDASAEIQLFNDMAEIDLQSMNVAEDDQQLDESLPEPVTEDAVEPMAKAASLALPFTSTPGIGFTPGAMREALRVPELPFQSAAEVPAAGFKRVAKKVEAQAQVAGNEHGQPWLDRNPQVRVRAAADPATPVEGLMILARDQYKTTRAEVAMNPSATEEVLSLIANDREPDIRGALLRNPNCPQELKTRLRGASKRQALLADGWAPEEVDAHLAGQ